MIVIVFPVQGLLLTLLYIQVSSGFVKACQTSVVKCSRFYCYFNLEMITKYLVELYNLFSALMLPAQGSKRECCVNKI